MSKSLKVMLVCCGILLFPFSASAYIGPGAGLSLLGAMWALIIAIVAALVFVFTWPIRRMLRRKREAQQLEAEHAEPSTPEQELDEGRRQHSL